MNAKEGYDCYRMLVKDDYDDDDGNCNDYEQKQCLYNYLAWSTNALQPSSCSSSFSSFLFDSFFELKVKWKSKKIDCFVSWLSLQVCLIKQKNNKLKSQN